MGRGSRWLHTEIPGGVPGAGGRSTLEGSRGASTETRTFLCAPRRIREPPKRSSRSRVGA